MKMLLIQSKTTPKGFSPPINYHKEKHFGPETEKKAKEKKAESRKFQFSALQRLPFDH